MNQYKSIWISDLHLGTRGCKADDICKFLKENNCETLYLVGDIVDGWKLSRGWHWPQSHSNVIRKILTKAKRGTKVIYVIGNHDEFFRSWLQDSVLDVGDIQFTNSVDHIDVHGRKWIVTHGDLFDTVTVHYKWVSILGDRAYAALLASNRIVHKFRSLFGLGYWSLSQYIKQRTKQAVSFIYQFEESLARYAKDNNAHGIICGHIHTPALKTINGIVYINEGDWVESCSALVETYDGEFKLLQLSSSNEMQIIATYQ